MTTKYVYYFGPGGVEGDASMKNTLGGKGANLAEMAKLGLPVPAGFTITTEYCMVYLEQGKKFTDEVKKQVADALAKVEKAMGMKYGDPENPLLVSCRSGARKSMPGMMETVLNVGLSSKTIPGMIKKTNNPRFVYDAYRRLIMMYSDVVMEKAEDLEPAEGKGIRKILDEMLDEYKHKRGYKSDTDLTADDLKCLAEEFKATIKKYLKKEFPDDPMEQLWGGTGAVFKSWNGKRAVSYRRIEGIPDEWGTAVNVQSMVFGNMGGSSATGVAFSRNPATGENKFYGEWLVNAQGEDVVAGIRPPSPLNEATKNDQNKHLKSLETEMSELYKQLDGIRLKLENHYKDMQDIEFTIQEGKLYMLQCRNGKRTAVAELAIAIDMLQEGILSKREVVLRVAPEYVSEVLGAGLVQTRGQTPIGAGLPAQGGAVSGQVALTSERALRLAREGHAVILVKEELNPGDVPAARAARGVLTARGGMTSHAALIARGWRKPCIVGAAFTIDHREGFIRIGRHRIKEGEYITINGTRGEIFCGRLPVVSALADPRVMAFVEIVRDADPDDYAPEAIGTIWLLKDTVAKYAMPIDRNPVVEEYAPVNLREGDAKDPDIQCEYVSFKQPAETTIDLIPDCMNWSLDSDMIRLAWGLLGNLTQRLQRAVGLGNHHLVMRPLVDPERSRVFGKTPSRAPLSGRRPCQLVGVEFFGLNRFLKECLPWGCVEWWGVIAEDERRRWRLDRTNLCGESLVPGADDLRAFLVVVDGRQLPPEETKEFYRQLRGRESQWEWYRENNVSWREMKQVLRHIGQNHDIEEDSIKRCMSAGILTRDGKLSSAGVSLLSNWTSMDRRNLPLFLERGAGNEG